MKKRIVILALTLSYGGIEKYISSLCKMFMDDYDVKIICNYKELEKPAFDYYNADIEYIINHGLRTQSIKELLKRKKVVKIILELVNRVKITLQESILVKQKIKNLKCDVIITTRLKHNQLVNKYLKNSNILKIATEHNSYDINKNYDKQICRSVSNYDYLVLVSKTQKSHYDKMFGRCIYIPNVIDNIPHEISNLNSLNLISVGRLSPEKGFSDLVKVMNNVVKINDKVKLYIAGDGEQKNDINILINEFNLNNNIIMLGYRTQKELEQYYLNSSLYVMPSYSEAFGIVLLEAMSYGLPCIAFDSAKGACEILGNEKGILIKDRDIQVMANSILKLLNDNERLIHFQDMGRSCVKNYEINKVRKKWINLLESKERIEID